MHTISPVQVSTPSITLANLRQVLADMESAHPERGQRYQRAANIVALRRIEPTASGTFWVQSECDPTKEYWVCPLPEFNVWRCNCKDFQQRGGPCKHALAVQMFQECERRSSNLIPFPIQTLSDNEPIPYELTPKALALLETPHYPVA